MLLNETIYNLTYSIVSQSGFKPLLYIKSEKTESEPTQQYKNHVAIN